MNRYNRTFWMILLVFLLLFVVVNVLVTKPLVSDLIRSYQEYKDTQKKLASLEKEKTIINEQEKNKTQISDMHAKIETFLPETIKSDDFAVQLEDIAFLSNQNITEISIKPKKESVPATSDDTSTNKANPTSTTPAAATGMQDVEFTLNEFGGFEGLMQFIENMEKMSRLNNFKVLSISAGANNQVISKIEGVIYYKPSMTIEKNPVNLELTTSDITNVNNLEHFGVIVTAPDYNSLNLDRGNPFLSK